MFRRNFQGSNSKRNRPRLTSSATKTAELRCRPSWEFSREGSPAFLPCTFFPTERMSQTLKWLTSGGDRGVDFNCRCSQLHLVKLSIVVAWGSDGFRGLHRRHWNNHRKPGTNRGYFKERIQGRTRQSPRLGRCVEIFGVDFEVFGLPVPNNIRRWRFPWITVENRGLSFVACRGFSWDRGIPPVPRHSFL